LPLTRSFELIEITALSRRVDGGVALDVPEDCSCEARHGKGLYR
jgi:hypothetical protein